MTARPINPETAAVRIKIAHLVWAAFVAGSFLVSATAWGVRKLNTIESGIIALQDAQPKYWTLQDEERRGNWLVHDNPNLALKMRDVREVVGARNP